MMTSLYINICIWSYYLWRYIWLIQCYTLSKCWKYSTPSDLNWHTSHTSYNSTNYTNSFTLPPPLLRNFFHFKQWTWLMAYNLIQYSDKKYVTQFINRIGVDFTKKCSTTPPPIEWDIANISTIPHNVYIHLSLIVGALDIRCWT